MVTQNMMRTCEGRLAFSNLDLAPHSELPSSRRTMLSKKFLIKFIELQLQSLVFRLGFFFFIFTSVGEPLLLARPLTPPPLLVAGPLKKKNFFAASLGT